jgi:cutinase
MRYNTELLAMASAIACAAAAPASPCSPVELVWARGSIEPQASFGPFVGDGFIAALRKAIPEMTYYNVVYPASMGAQSPATGVADTIKHITQQASQCPNQK